MTLKSTTLRLRTPEPFDLELVVRSHGWYTLAPFTWDEEGRTLATSLHVEDRVHDVAIRPSPTSGLLVDVAPDPGGSGREEVRGTVRRMLGLDEDLEPFHALCREDPDLRWAAHRGAGRLLRAPTVWEDLVKVLCTTNCSWALTRTMVSNLVDHAGSDGPSGRRAFPAPADLEGREESFYRDTVRAGYRAGALTELVGRVARGELDPEGWAEPDRDLDGVHDELLGIRGVGPYAAEQVLRLLGSREGLALDSWCRATFAELHHGGEPVDDEAIRARYASFGPWAGLALWLDLTRPWHE